ncbi:hypothetical protein [Jiangella ureilytica]|uniref:hypothetical protein n=1 Tax=Jiangella ureilytica TaxID=2530374 RepID=UPI00193CA807|nr:hypothetical protein [Jiangella ureilytica]
MLAVDAQLEALRMLLDRRDELMRRRVQTVNRLHRLLSELLPGMAKKDITSPQAQALLRTVRRRDLVGKTRRRIAADEVAAGDGELFAGLPLGTRAGRDREEGQGAGYTDRADGGRVAVAPDGSAWCRTTGGCPRSRRGR